MQDKVLTMKFSTPAFALDFAPVNTIGNIITPSLYMWYAKQSESGRMHILENMMKILV
jgi:hypothetical protein